MRVSLFLSVLAVAFLASATPAFAYGGPGAAIGLLGAIAAFGSAIVFAFVYGVVLPIKRKIKGVAQHLRAKSDEPSRRQ